MSTLNDQGTTRSITSILNPLDGVNKDSNTGSINWIIPAILFLLISLITAASVFLASSRHQTTLEENLEQRLNTVAVSQSTIVENQLANQVNAARELVNLSMLRLVLSEYEKDQNPSPLLARLQDAVQAFRTKHRFDSAFVLTQDSATLLGSSKNDSGTAQIFRNLVPEVLQTAKPKLTPLRTEEARLYLDILHPIFEFQKAAANTPYQAVGVLVTSTDVTELFSTALQSSLDNDRTQSLLFLPEEQTYKLLNDQGIIQRYAEPFELDSLDVTYGPSVRNQRLNSYRKIAPVSGTNWAVVREADQSVVVEEVNQFKLVVGAMTFLFLTAITATVTVVWLRQRSQRDKDLALQYRKFAQKLQFQNRFIDTINRAIPDAILLKDSNGKVVYTNPAALGIFNEPDENGDAQATRVHFDEGTASWIRQLDARALESGDNISEHFILKQNQDVKHLIISAIPFVKGDGNYEETNNILNVARDITDIVKSQNERIKMVEKTVMTLVSIIERRDPYLKGHSVQLAKIAMAIGKEMKLPGEDIRYLNYAGSLSQIGKTFIPQEILTKTERLNDPEIKEMKKHIHYTIETVKELGMPVQVIQGLSHMYERLDGSGYPEGLSGDEISREGRILAIADILVARVSERSYRKAISVDTALNIFTDNPDKYDQEVTACLSRLCTSKLIQDLLH